MSTSSARPRTVGVDRARRSSVGTAASRRARRRARRSGPRVSSHRAGLGVLPRHVDHRDGKRRDPERGPASPCGRAAPVHGRGGRSPQRRTSRPLVGSRGRQGRRQQVPYLHAGLSFLGIGPTHPVRGPGRAGAHRHVTQHVPTSRRSGASRSPTRPPRRVMRRPSTASASVGLTSWCAPSTEPWDSHVARARPSSSP